MRTNISISKWQVYVQKGGMWGTPAPAKALLVIIAL